MDLPRISIVTPTLNQGGYIQQTIESVLKQNYPNLDYIVMDGGSTDGTIDILRSYGNRIRWISNRDNGQADAINRGMEMADGEILSFINSDDYYLPGVFELIARTFHETQCQWLTGDYRVIDPNGREIHQLIVWYKKLWRRNFSPQVLAVLNFVAQPSTFWSRTLWCKIGPLDISLRYTFDYDFWVRAALESSPIVEKKALSVFRIHKTSKGGAEYRYQFAEELKVLQRYHPKPLVFRLHQLHNSLINSIYRIIK